MRDKAEKIEIQVDEHYRTSFACPACGNLIALDLSGGTKGRLKLGLECDCQKNYEVTVSRRRHERREVALETRSEIVGSRDVVPTTIVQLSRKGLKFQPERSGGFEVGSLVEVTFSLGDPETEMKKRLVVRNVTPEGIGGEFVSAESSAYDRCCDVVLASYALEISTAG